MTKDMTKGAPLKLILQFAFSTCLGLLFQQLYSMVDTMLVGLVLGVNPLAGVGATGSLNFMVIYFCIGICNGFAIPIAQAFGAKKEADVRRYVTNSTWLCFLFGGLITLFVCVFCRQMLTLLGTPENIFEYAYIYILIIFLGIPFTFLYNMLASIARSLGDSKTPVLFLALSSGLNIVLDLVLMIPIPLGVAGAALATVIAQAVSGIICLFYMKRRFQLLTFSRDDWRIRGQYVKNLCQIGLPMGLQYSITGIGTLVITAAVNTLGAMAVAGVTAATKISNLITCPIEALGQTMAPYSGQNIGAGRRDRVKAGVIQASLCGFVWSVLCIPAMYFLARPLTMLFLDEVNEAVLQYSFQFLMIAVMGYCFLTLVNVVRLAIQGMGHSGIAMAAGVLEMLARTFAGVVLAGAFGFTGICFGHMLAWICADAFLIPTIIYLLRKPDRTEKKTQKRRSFRAARA